MLLTLALLAAAVDGKEFKMVRLPNAKCNDGTPAVYYIAANASSSSWVVWLQGGGLCHDLEDCKRRAQGSLGSSKDYAPSIDPPRGMLSSDTEENPDLATWNKIYVPYCSGDLWMGMAKQATNPFPQQDSWSAYFQGHLILEEIATLLKVRERDGGVTQAVLTGCSAGGIGTITNCDWFASLFGDGVDVGCRPEAGWFGVPHATYPYFVSPAGPSSDPDPYKVGMWNWTAHVEPYLYSSDLGKRCAADVASGKLRIKHCDVPEVGPAFCCASPPLAYAYSRTRMFISENTADAYQVFTNGQCPDQASSCIISMLDRKATSFWGYIRETITDSLVAHVVNGTKRHQDGLFAPACLVHCMVDWQGSVKVGGKTDAQAFGDWFFRRGAPDGHMLLDTDAKPYDLCRCQHEAAAAAPSAHGYLSCETDGFWKPAPADSLNAESDHIRTRN